MDYKSLKDLGSRLGVRFGIEFRAINSHAKIVLCTPVQPHPLESTPQFVFLQHASHMKHPPWKMDRMALTVTYPYDDFGVKIRPFGDDHIDLCV